MKGNPIRLTKEQKAAVRSIIDFVTSEDDIFILTGAAGTGKTTVIKNIIESIDDIVDEISLLAPTNRAVKVLAKKTGVYAETVHNKIYTIRELKDDDGNVLSHEFIPRIYSLIFDEGEVESLKDLTHVYIVDESSMLSASPQNSADLISENSIMEDLFRHVKYKTPKNKIIFVGDSYQLPPIGYDGIAPALSKEYIEKEYTNRVRSFQLKEILRQSSGSPILELAGEIKEKIDEGEEKIYLNIPRFNSYDEFLDEFIRLYDQNEQSKCIALGWRRKDVLQLNLDIRQRILNKPGYFEKGDILYVNSKWSNTKYSIPKGEIGRVIKVVKDNGNKGGLRFHTLLIEFYDMNDKPQRIKAKVLTNFAHEDVDYLPKRIFQKLAIERSKVNKSFKKSRKAIDDKYMSAMQVKFAYALTVHKAQGGEWENIFLHKITNTKDLRWNYTAITRASKNIFSYW